MFDNVNNQAIHLEIHYDNPSLIEGRKDSSGLRFFYSESERTHRAGILQVGDPFLSLYGQDIKDGLTQYEFTCPGTCSDSILAKERSGDNQAVTVFSECKSNMSSFRLRSILSNLLLTLLVIVSILYQFFICIKVEFI